MGIKEDNERTALWYRLKKEGATCAELAFHGWIRIYEEGEKRCECKDCVAILSSVLNRKMNDVRVYN